MAPGQRKGVRDEREGRCSVSIQFCNFKPCYFPLSQVCPVSFHLLWFLAPYYILNAGLQYIATHIIVLCKSFRWSSSVYCFMAFSTLQDANRGDIEIEGPITRVVDWANLSQKPGGIYYTLMRAMYHCRLLFRNTLKVQGCIYGYHHSGFQSFNYLDWNHLLTWYGGPDGYWCSFIPHTLPHLTKLAMAQLLCEPDARTIHHPFISVYVHMCVYIMWVHVY